MWSYLHTHKCKIRKASLFFIFYDTFVNFKFLNDGEIVSSEFIMVRKRVERMVPSILAIKPSLYIMQLKFI